MWGVAVLAAVTVLLTGGTASAETDTEYLQGLIDASIETGNPCEPNPGFCYIDAPLKVEFDEVEDGDSLILRGPIVILPEEGVDENQIDALKIENLGGEERTVVIEDVYFGDFKWAIHDSHHGTSGLSFPPSSTSLQHSPRIRLRGAMQTSCSPQCP
jgi:hypothetical protein